MGGVTCTIPGSHYFHRPIHYATPDCDSCSVRPVSGRFNTVDIRGVSRSRPFSHPNITSSKQTPCSGLRRRDTEVHTSWFSYWQFQKPSWWRGDLPFRSGVRSMRLTPRDAEYWRKSPRWGGFRREISLLRGFSLISFRSFKGIISPSGFLFPGIASWYRHPRIKFTRSLAGLCLPS